MEPEMHAIEPGRRSRLAATASVSLLLGLLVFTSTGQWRSGAAHGQASSGLKVQSSSFSSGQAIPRQYTCDGANLSPNLQWQAAPPKTKSFAIVMRDSDAPIDFAHWLVYNIPPAIHGLAEGASLQSTMPNISSEGVNDFGRSGYGGPCPPPGKLHHYIFHVYALDARLSLPRGAGKIQLDPAIRPHILAEGRIVGVYQRFGR